MKSLLLSLVAVAHFAQAAEKPNIIVILADDMGYSDLGCYGSEIDTPHLDALAASGTRFTRFYNTPRCCPTRATLLTGIYAHQAGIGHMMQNRGVPSYQGYLNDRCVTLAEVLKPAGYATLMSGKWHVGTEPGHWPLDRGFDRYWGTPKGGGVYFKETLALRPDQIFVKDSSPVNVPDDMYVTDSITDHAIEFIDQAVTTRKKPFFLYLAHIAPHYPLQAKPQDIAKYKGKYDIGWDVIRDRRFAKQKELGVIPANTTLSPRDEKSKPWEEVPAAERKKLAHHMEIYAAQVDCIDQNTGRLIAKLKELGQFENTLILFLSDNGCSPEGGPGGFSKGEKGAPVGTGKSYASLGLEWANVCNTPYRKFKADTREGGICSPFIVHGPPSLVKAAAIRHQPAHLIDIMPTLIEIGGASYPTEYKNKAILPMEGRSLVASFQNETNDARQLFWEHEGHAAVRDGSWKAVRNTPKAAWQLYDLEKDPTELNDLSTEQPERLKALSASWDAWARRVAAAPFAGKLK